ncbi:MAG: RNA polymerase sigma-70 factor ECF [Planctomycetota bacterium]|nr:MAG: RNA polymerase sigma-70 factor ECF [Planctomycetota bacterium]
MAHETRLIDGLRAGSRAEFSTLVERHAREVYAFLARLSGVEVAEKLTHETFATAWNGASTFQTDRPLRVWLLGLAAKAAAAREGFDGRWEAAARVELDSAGAAHPEIPADHAEAGRLAALAVADLPFPQRAALVLRAFGGFGIPEISATLNASGDAVAALLGASYLSFVNRLEVRAVR